MFVARFVECAVRKTIALGIAVLLVTAGFAQNATQSSGQASPAPMTAMPQAPAPQHNAHLYSDQDYSRASAPFPNVIAPYRSRSVPAPNLSNSARTDQLFRDGKMYLSINDAVAMALENNLDIVLQRYNLSIADTDLLRTKSGTGALGVAQGVVQGTPRRAHRPEGLVVPLPGQPEPGLGVHRSVSAALAPARVAWCSPQLEPDPYFRATTRCSSVRFKANTQLRPRRTSSSPAELRASCKTRIPITSVIPRHFQRAPRHQLLSTTAGSQPMCRMTC